MIQWKFVIPVVFFIASLSSCINLTEELTVNEDGSGDYAITFDLRQIYADPTMKDLIRSMIYEGQAVSMSHFGVIDTIIHFKNIPDSVRKHSPRPAFWDQVKMSLKIDERQKIMKAKLFFPFESLDEIDHFFQNLDQIREQRASAAGLLTNQPFLSKGRLFEIRKNLFIRYPISKQESIGLADEYEDPASLFHNATYTTIYRLPGTIKKTSIPKAQIADQKITATYTFADILNGKVNMDGEVKFK